MEGRSGADRESVERTVRSALTEITEVIERLERTCRAGSITPDELSEERDLLRAQRQSLSSRLE
jgi:hypothetical protein